ncbi:protein MODIFIER OF SNC1 1-like [Gastrolobium bilobum]|uniref:protein MODIFIER OF SNC1 1-like n=1 Tax=Gastrolobium bilobum TaxID=150636 RepID=UPI002AB2C4A4|nr:protein MODIFIER OF SNC1 1-like [Gastrolobium bilobum]
MTSSMLGGERRWASSKRGGMTVLGKVAVPKPINLPSQRLENHGLDPNVDIAPKGTLSWGSKSSSSASNAWGSSSLSPNANGATSSPSHLSARPSSGGSGTQPSTSGSSDMALELATNAWGSGSNSRPSSASGALTPNQTSPTLRPRSAETRPGSSQLSRFAEHVTENSVARSAGRTTEKLGVTQCKNDGFSLSSGDFPTLVSEKDKSVLNFELQDHSSHARPGSSSGIGKKKNESSAVDDVPVNANLKGETENSWRRDYQAFNDDGERPGIEKWKGNPQPYPNAGIPPQYFDAWHGAPVNNHQGDVWFRGPPNGPPFANPVAPGGFPIEPFPYYSPHIPPTGLANPPQVPPPGTGPRGHHKNGDVYRPHMPDAYIHPGMPLRPGFYPGPMAYEGYYSPPMGYCNSNERDVPFMGMGAGPSVFIRYSNQHPPEPGNSQGRSGGYGPAGKPLASELVESSYSPDTVRPCRVLLKQHDEWDGKNEPTNWEDSVTTNASCVNGRNQPQMSAGENELRRDTMDLRRTSAHGEEASYQTLRNQGSSSSVINAKSLESKGSFNKFDDISARKLDGVASNVLEIPSSPSAPKDSSLMQKIGGLNAKARDNSSTKSKEEQRSKFHAGIASANHVENEVSAGVLFPETTHATEVMIPTTRGVGTSGGEKNFESLSFSGTARSRKIANGMQGRGNHGNKGRLNNQDADSLRKKSENIYSSTSSGAQLEASNILVGDHQISVDAYERSGSNRQARRNGKSIQTLSDPVDGHAQHAKIKELVKQQTKQRQGEEEEQNRKQKVKALMKLDELKRCSQAVEGSIHKERATNSALQNNQVGFQTSESGTILDKSEAVTPSVMSNANVVCQTSNTNINKVENPPISSSAPPLELLKNAGKEPVLNHNQSVTLCQDFSCADATNALLVHNNVASKQRRTGYKQKQNLSSEKTSNVKVVSTTTSAVSKVENDTMACATVSSGVVTNAASSGLPMNSTSMVESSINQKKKNNKNKHKVEETSSLSALLSAIPKEAMLSKSSAESNKPKEDFELEQGSLQPASLSKDLNLYSEQNRYLANEESHGRMNTQLKSQHSRRMPRSMQANRQAEKSHGSDAVMWAPVKPQNKTQILDESSEKSNLEVIIPVKSDQQVHNLKNKRAEMERYIPKPVAKEMSQQESLQQVVSSISQAPTDESVERVDSGSQGPQTTRHTNPAVGKVGFGRNSKTGNGRRTKQGKANGSWQLRNPTESTDIHDMQDGVNHGSNSDQNTQISMECQQAQLSETSLLKGQTKHFNDSDEPYGSNNPDNCDSAALVSIPIKDLVAMDKERQVPFKGPKEGTGVNHDVDQMKNAGDREKNEMLFSSSEHNQLDVGAAFPENQSVGERMTSHWQPKYQTSNNQRGNKPKDQNVGAWVDRVNKEESTAHVGVSFLDGCGKESKALVAQHPHDQSVPGKSKVGEAPNLGKSETNREKRNAPPKGCPHSPNQVVGSNGQAPTSMNLGHEQRPSSGFHKNGNQNRFGKGHESQGDWKSPAQDNRHHHNQPTNWERQGPNLHHQYRRVVPYDDSKSGSLERPKDGSYPVGGRFRERGQTHLRGSGGSFSGR